MSVAPLVAKVRINIPVSGDAATVLSAIGGLIVVAIVVFFAYAKIKDEGRQGWLWLGGWVGFIFTFLATAIFFGRRGAPDESYFLVAIICGALGVASVLALRAAGSVGAATGVASMGALALIAKIVFLPPINIVMQGEDFQFYPAGPGDPKVFVVILMALAFAALAFWVRRSSDSAPAN
jgi:hypothetical protein